MNTNIHLSTDLKIGRFELALRLILALVCAISFLSLVHTASAAGSTQISGIGYFTEEGECTEAIIGPNGQSADFANRMEGDLQGCLYVFVESGGCQPSGVYLETGSEIFVGDGSEGNNGTFSTTYKFEGKFQDCANFSGQVFGRCQHPIVNGSGTGDFAGVKGRINFKDDIAAGNFPYTGHLSFK